MSRGSRGSGGVLARISVFHKTIDMDIKQVRFQDYM